MFKDIKSLSFHDESLTIEAERLLAEIAETKEKIKCAWNHLDYAAPEYVEIAVLELLIVETQYSLLNKRYRLLLGINKSSSYGSRPFRKEPSSSLEERLRNHPFYGALLDTRQAFDQQTQN